MPETSFFDQAAPGAGRARTTPDRLDGTVALVTGASSGIGAATAIALAGEGAAVAVAARRKDRLEEVAAGIREQGGTVLVLESDITGEQQATDAVEQTVAELGRLDTLVNNAGVMLLGPRSVLPCRSGSGWSTSTSWACSTARTQPCRTCSARPRRARAGWPTW
jgi:NAD(P)-dependent dehydrogenase (short-subunit alcohol dehydrogenase family)